MGEIIELPSQPFTDLRPVQFRAKLQSFPRQEFGFRFEWNNSRNRYVMRITHLNRDNGFVVERSMVQYRRAYSYLPFVEFFFSDPSGGASEITPENLGDNVLMYAVPGPEGAPPETWDRPPAWVDA